MKDIWNERYASKEFVYGKEPNQFFAATIEALKLTGKLLLPAEGEGRNAIYAAKLGFTVLANDISIEGKNKALEYAKEEQVSIDYFVGPTNEIDAEEESFDVAALVFAHFPPPVRAMSHRKVANLLKPGGIVILEGFSVNNLKYRTENPKVGGPNIPEMLFTKELILKEFHDFKTIKIEEQEVTLKEGKLHDGTGKVIRFIGKKIAIE